MTADTPDQPTSDAAGTPAAPAPPAPAPPPADDKASGGMRALAVLIGLVLLFAAIFAFVFISNPDDTPRCDQIALAQAAGECFDITKTQQTVSSVLMAPAGALALAAGLLGFVVAVTGRRGELMVRLGVGALVLGGLAVLVNQI